ncbi:MAG: DUF2000 family protein [Devosia sp.]|jgi:hypothetical protein|nr:DUF2000 family protein [Devosia sp.]
MFETKIAIVLRDDLAPWQALNVTAFLATGVTAQHSEIIGEPYVDRVGNRFSPLSVQPVIVLAADADTMRAVQQRALQRGIVTSAYTEEMFSTGHDAANRAVFAQFAPEDARLVGIGLRAERKLVDKVTKGARMHP